MVSLSSATGFLRGLLHRFGLAIVRISDDTSIAGASINCLLSDTQLIEYFKARPITEDAELIQKVGKQFLAGAGYANFKSQTRPLLGKLLARMALPKDYSLLDVGCGIGYLVPLLKEIKPPGLYVGIDIVRAVIAFAHRRFGQGASFGHFIQGDACRLPFPDNSFDCVYSRSTLISTYDWKRALAEQLRVARRYVILLRTPFHRGGSETIFFMQHSKIHTSLLCSFTRAAFLDNIPSNAKVEIEVCSSFPVVNFGLVQRHNVFIELP